MRSLRGGVSGESDYAHAFDNLEKSEPIVIFGIVFGVLGGISELTPSGSRCWNAAITPPSVHESRTIGWNQTHRP
jgi:hypothetical protein